MKLLTSQKDILFDLIEKVGLSPSQFEFNESISELTAGQKATNLIFKHSDYFFSFESGPNSSTNHFAIFCPGTNAFTERENPGSWDYQLNRFRTWLSNLIREINTPNKWDRLDKEIAGIAIIFENDEDKFSVQEFEDLKQKIETLKQSIASTGLLPEQVSVINDKLDHLTDLAKEMNKFDWKGLFIGTIISLVIQLSVTPESAESLWSLIKLVFNNYLLP